MVAAVLVCLTAVRLGSAQLSCETAVPVSLGVTEVATLPTFGDFVLPGPSCVTDGTLAYHATYLKFIAPSDGWYMAYAIPVGAPLWRTRLAAVPDCSGAGPADYDFWSPGAYVSDTGDQCGNMRQIGRALFHMQAGQSRILAVGGMQTGESGHANVKISYLGTTQMSGAQELVLGTNAYTVAPMGQSVRINSDACWQVGNTSRFRFTPLVAGTYRVSFCDNNSQGSAYVSTDPDMQSSTQSNGWCNGPQFLVTMKAGVTHYFAAGTNFQNSPQGCATKNAFVEYVRPCPGDINQDSVTDGADLGILLASWNTPAGDITGDGDTDGLDLGILLATWGACPP